MGDLRLNNISYSNNGTGVLMLNGVNYTGGGSGGGNSFDTVLENGVISTDRAYATASFNDISDYEYVIIRIRNTVGGTDYYAYAVFEISDIPVSGYKEFTVNLHRQISCRITRMSISSFDYAGSYVYIYADIVATTEDMFPTI